MSIIRRQINLYRHLLTKKYQNNYRDTSFNLKYLFMSVDSEAALSADDPTRPEDPFEDESSTLDVFRETYSDARKEGSSLWLDFKESCYIYLYKGGGSPNEILASFDLDGTLIKPKSNKRIPKSATDWELFSVWTKVKLQQVLKENRARFLMFTNQNGVGLNLVSLEEVQKRVELVAKRLDIPCIVFVATQKNEFRKPMTGMFKLFLKSFNDSKPINYEKSFYCGDAIGYPSHSDADVKFAQILGLPFLTPEKFLRGVKPKLVDPK